MSTSENLKTIPAHFDGQQIHLDEPYPLKQNDKLLVVVLQDVSDDEERDDWAHISLGALKNAYGDDEPEYSLNTLKESNPDYEGK
ncbi:MAG: hypothetical protein ACI8V2_004569 [Candidatus Latescibacterota bacterium]|jgi:hypothetical protein